MTSFLIILMICTMLVAILYSSVGHGGASGYIAVMALFSIAPAAFKPTALLLNIVVATVATWSFARAGHFSWRLFLPFALTSIPCSFIGGYLNLPPHLYKPLVGIILLLCAMRLIFHAETGDTEPRRPPFIVSLVVGSGVGLLSGLTGVGGGIFLSPLCILLRWGKAREVSAVVALFILVNSIAGLLGHLSSLGSIPHYSSLLAAAALTGGTIGSLFGSRYLPVAGVVRTLSVVLATAGVKMLLI